MARPARSTPTRASSSKNTTTKAPQTKNGAGKKKSKDPGTRASSSRAGNSKRRGDSDEDEEAGPQYKETESSSSSSSSGEEGVSADEYKEPDSDAIDDTSEDEDGDDDYSVREEEEEDEEEEMALHAVDEDSNGEEVLDFSVTKKTSSSSRTSSAKKRKGKGKAGDRSSPSKRVKRRAGSDDDHAEASGSSNLSDAGDEDDEDEVLRDGRKVKVTKLVKAPTRDVKPGLIDRHTMQFLSDLVDNNDREWFAKNEPRYRHALKNWQTFVDAVQPEIQRGDWSIPELPAKELIYRIYRDVRFSNDKTPYKKNFSASFSRTGRKGPFAGYYLQISPGGRSLIAGGKWSPEKNDLATIRTNIIRSSKPLRRVLSAPDFVKWFGPPKPDGLGKGKRCNVFGHDDMLKVAPKMHNVDKTHKDIDLLKLRTIAVVHNFTDEEVLAPDFKNKVGDAVAVMAPLVLLLNEMTHPQSEDEAQEEEDIPSESEQAEITAASGKEQSDPENSDEPVEEDDEDGMSEGGGIEAA